METIANVVLFVLTIIMGAVFIYGVCSTNCQNLIAMMIATIAHFQGVMMLQERMWISSDFYYR
jgi:hypothetical protein